MTGDTFHFDEVTANGPFAVGSHAVASSGTGEAASLHRLQAVVAQFQAACRQAAPSLEPGVGERVELALADVSGSMRHRPIDWGAIRDSLTALTSVAAS